MLIGCVRERAAYVCANMNEILKMPIDLNCLNQELLAKLAGMLTVMFHTVHDVMFHSC